MKILISSISSFIGSRLGIYLKRNGYDVVLGSRSKKTFIPHILRNNEVRIINWDSAKSLNNACKNIDVVIHTAGVNAQDCEKNPTLAHKFNAFSTYSFGNASIKNSVSLFIYLSTIHVYKKENHELDELSPLEENNTYSSSKIKAEKGLKDLSNQEKTKFKILRLSNVFGVSENRNSNCWDLFINNLIKNAFLEGKLTIKSNPSINRDFLPMNVLNLLIENQLKHNSGNDFFKIYNCISGKTFTLLNIANLIQQRVLKNKNKYLDIFCQSKSFDLPEKKYKSIYTQPKFDLEIEFIKEIDEIIHFCEKEF